MFGMEKVTGNASLDFKWLKKTGVGQNNGVQFYESFILHGTKYKLYDCVYMYNEGLGEHYIGKLTKVWECHEKTKKVDVHWFFRPEEIPKWLGETKTLEKEILIATGEGLGLTNINPLEAIVTLCNVVCVSKDRRNPQPSDEQLKAADFVFYRTCDVQTSAISDKMDDKVGGLEVKYIFNKKETEKASPLHESIPDTKEEHQSKDIHSLLERNTNFKESDKARVELEVACDSKRCKEMSSKKSMVDSKSKHEDKLPADVNNLNASRTSGTTEDQKKRKISAKETSDDLEGKKLMKRTDDGSFKVSDSKMGINTNVRDLVAISKGKSKSGIALDILGNNKHNIYNKEGKEGQSGESNKEHSMTKSQKVSALSTNKVKKKAYREFVVSPKPNADTCSWLSRPGYEDNRLQKAYNQGTAILLHNVDPDYNSGEVEDIIWHAFNVKCDAKILQRTSVSSPHYAQAIIVLKTMEAAQRVLTKLDEQCLMISSGRNGFMPLVATPCPPVSTKKNSCFFGHLAVGKARFRNQHEYQAVSTSHFSQPNTIEYDMALDWRLLQSQSMKLWEKLHEQQSLELENLKNDLKENVHEDS